MIFKTGGCKMPSVFFMKGGGIMLSQYLQIGQVLRPQGIKGLVKVRPDTDDPDRFKGLQTVYIKQYDDYEKIPVNESIVREDGVYLRLNGAQDRDTAEKQRNWMLYVDRKHARPLEENETFICDLIGCRVVDRQNHTIGEVTDVMQPGGNDVYVIRTNQGEMLLPALKFVIPVVNPAEGYIQIDESRIPEVAVCSWLK